jgi:hypothetical protein
VDFATGLAQQTVGHDLVRSPTPDPSPCAHSRAPARQSSNCISSQRRIGPACGARPRLLASTSQRWPERPGTIPIAARPQITDHAECRTGRGSLRLDYCYEQKGRRPIVALAIVVGLCLTALGLHLSAPWPFTAIVALAALMALVLWCQNSRSGLQLQGSTLTLFKDQWRHVIDVATIRAVRVTPSSGGQPSVWLDLEGAPPYRLPGYCFGAAEPLKAAFRKRGVPVD